jgi:hypothetical protein
VTAYHTTHAALCDPQQEVNHKPCQDATSAKLKIVCLRELILVALQVERAKLEADYRLQVQALHMQMEQVQQQLQTRMVGMADELHRHVPRLFPVGAANPAFDICGCAWHALALREERAKNGGGHPKFDKTPA